MFYLVAENRFHLTSIEEEEEESTLVINLGEGVYYY